MWFTHEFNVSRTTIHQLKLHVLLYSQRGHTSATPLLWDSSSAPNWIKTKQKKQWRRLKGLDHFPSKECPAALIGVTGINLERYETSSCLFNYWQTFVGNKVQLSCLRITQCQSAERKEVLHKQHWAYCVRVCVRACVLRIATHHTVIQHAQQLLFCQIYCQSSQARRCHQVVKAVYVHLNGWHRRTKRDFGAILWLWK